LQGSCQSRLYALTYSSRAFCFLSIIHRQMIVQANPQTPASHLPVVL
jgi:hypothetical protein